MYSYVYRNRKISIPQFPNVSCQRTEPKRFTNPHHFSSQWCRRFFVMPECGAGDSSYVRWQKQAAQCCLSFSIMYTTPEHFTTVQKFYVMVHIYTHEVWTFEHTHLATRIEQCSFVYTRGYILSDKWKVEVVGGGDIHVNWFSVSDTLVGLTGNWKRCLSTFFLLLLLLLLSKNLVESKALCTSTMTKTFLNFIFPNILVTYGVNRISCSYTDNKKWNDIRKRQFVAEK